MIEVLDYLGQLMKVRGDKGLGLRTISHGHSKAHDGKVWVHPHAFTGLGAAAAVEVVVSAAANKKIHVGVLKSFSSAGIVSVFRNPTITGGTVVGGKNLNFSDESASPAAVVFAPTVGADGTLIDGAAPSTIPSDRENETPMEFILTGTNKLMVRFTATSADTDGFIKIVVTEEDF